MRVRPDTISPETWETLTEQEQAFFLEHERLHREYDNMLRKRELEAELALIMKSAMPNYKHPRFNEWADASISRLLKKEEA